MRRGYVFRPQSLLAGCTWSIGPHAVITQVLCGIMGYTQFVTVLSVKHLLLLCQIAFPFQKCMTHQPLMYFPTSSHFTFLFLETGSRPHPPPGFFFFFSKCRQNTSSSGNRFKQFPGVQSRRSSLSPLLDAELWRHRGVVNF